MRELLSTPVRVSAIAALSWLAASPAASLVPDHFESPPVHPVELSSDGSHLFVAHTADHRLVVFQLGAPLPIRVAEIMVGIEPVTVRARTPSEVWVVNHVSDSISIVDLTTFSVVRTLVVGDEPTDVAFVPAQHRAFVCVSQEDKVRVYDTNDLTLPPQDIPLSISDPHSLALSPGGGTLYVGALDSQNRTSCVPFQTVLAGGGLPPPNPPMLPSLPSAPDVGLIVRHDGVKWTDEVNRNWNEFLPFQVTDDDVLRIDTSSRAVTGSFRHAGTTLFNLAVSPTTGRIYVTNQEASNEIRFEPNVKGKFLKNRLTAIDPGAGTVTPFHLNAHVDYANEAGTPTERALSLAIPLDLTIASNGQTIYVAAFGSRKVGVLDAQGNVTRRITVGDGPCGLALDEPRNKLYVMNRLASSLSAVALSNDSRIDIPLGFDPTPLPVKNGRRFLYDGEISSAHGDLACASCHVFGAMDNIAWDLGNPLGEFIPPQFPGLQGFHPMKGPMTTQSLKGLGGTEPLHWRGDRADLAEFNPAFPNLMGAPQELTPGQFAEFEAFVMAMRYPPNPNRLLDGALPASLAGGNPIVGQQLFLTGNLVGALDCVSCHALPTGENGLIIPASLIAEDQDMKVPQLRNMFEKTRFDNTTAQTVRGFGFTHDGAVDDLVSFLQFPAFDFTGDEQREDVAAFLLAFDSGTHAGVGAQWTMDGSNEGAGIARVNTLVSLANGNAIGLVAKGRDPAGDLRGWTYQSGGAWRPDRAAEPNTTTSSLLALADPAHEITFTAVLEGTETRLGVDRDEDGYLDRDEIDAGTDPGDPLSNPGGLVGAPELVHAGESLGLWLRGANPARLESRLGFSLAKDGPARLAVFDLQGRRVAALVDAPRHPAGRFEASWNLRDERGARVAAGTYFVRLEGSGAVATDRVVVLR